MSLSKTYQRTAIGLEAIKHLKAHDDQQALKALSQLFGFSMTLEQFKVNPAMLRLKQVVTGEVQTIPTDPQCDEKMGYLSLTAYRALLDALWELGYSHCQTELFRRHGLMMKLI